MDSLVLVISLFMCTVLPGDVIDISLLADVNGEVAFCRIKMEFDVVVFTYVFPFAIVVPLRSGDNRAVREVFVGDNIQCWDDCFMRLLTLSWNVVVNEIVS
jgi:hypothetical protein